MQLETKRALEGNSDVIRMKRALEENLDMIKIERVLEEILWYSLGCTWADELVLIHPCQFHQRAPE